MSLYPLLGINKQGGVMKFIKKYGLVLALIFLSTNAFAVADWDKTSPASSSNAADIGTNVATNNNEALDRLLGDYRRDCSVVLNTPTSFNVLAGEIAIPNSDSSVVRWRKNTSTTAVTWANIDTGAQAPSTQYYVYAIGDATATTFTIKISTSSSAPSGSTYYRKIGYLYSDASLNIVSVGNIKGGDVPNVVIVSAATDINTSSTSYVDMTDMVIYFYSSGRPVKINLAGNFHVDPVSYMWFSLTVDGSSVKTARQYDPSGSQITNFEWDGVSSAGLHTIKAQWKVTANTAYSDGATYGSRQLTVEEL